MRSRPRRPIPKGARDRRVPLSTRGDGPVRAPSRLGASTCAYSRGGRQRRAIRWRSLPVRLGCQRCRDDAILLRSPAHQTAGTSYSPRPIRVGGAMPARVTGTGLDQLAVNTIKMLAVDAVEKAKSGHPGMPMGAADYTYVLWTRFLRYNPQDPAWPDRDRFVLSAGHGCMLLYAMLHLAGFDVPME